MLHEVIIQIKSDITKFHFKQKCLLRQMKPLILVLDPMIIFQNFTPNNSFNETNFSIFDISPPNDFTLHSGLSLWSKKKTWNCYCWI